MYAACVRGCKGVRTCARMDWSWDSPQWSFVFTQEQMGTVDQLHAMKGIRR